MNPLRSVAAKLCLLTSLFVLGVIALMSRELARQTEQGLVGEMRVRAEFFARSAREAVFPKLDPFSLHFHVGELLKEKAVTYALVMDPDGRVLSHSDSRQIGDTPEDESSRRARGAQGALLQRRSAADGTPAFDLAVPLRVGERRVGTARLGFDESSIQGALRAQKRRLFAVAAAAISAAIVGTVLIVGWITRPLPRLAAAAREIGKGRFDVRVDWRSGDEIGALARSFNDMAAASAVLFAAIREEKERFATIFRETREGMVWTDGGGRLLLMNPSARALLGCIEGSPDSLAQASSAFQSRPPLDALLGGKTRITPFELQRDDPKLLILSGVVDRLGTEDDPAGLLLVFHDATLEKRGEALARNFLSIVSHKLRTPLAVALGYLELLLGDAQLSSAQRQALLKIQAEDGRLRDLVEKLMVFTLVQSPQNVVLDKASCGLAELVDEALKARCALLGGTAVSLRWERDAARRLPAVAVDRGLVREAIANLLENAVKFNPAPRKSVAVLISREEGGLRVCVRDDGPGIPSEEQPKLFRKFYQIDDDFTGQVPGFGLGLAFVRSVAEAHGGSAGLRSAPGQGSEFYFTLPLEGRPAGPAEAKAA